MSILGTRVLRTEDPLFLTRGGLYTDDVEDERLTGALHVTFVRSPLAHARIVGVDSAEAEHAPGVVHVFTAADLKNLAPMTVMPGVHPAMAQPLLARDVVRFVGEPLALVVTHERYQGEDAASLVLVDYDPLPVVVDPREAGTDKTLLFPDAGTNTAMDHDWGQPGAEDLFDGCDVVVTQEVLNQRVAPAPLEVRAAAAALGTDGRLTAWLPTQGAQESRATLAAALGMDTAQVRIITPDVGGAFGAKWVDPEHVVVAWLARTLSAPVRWVETRSENLLAMTHGRGQVQTVTIGGTRDGRVLAYRLEVLQDCGAYPRFGAFLPLITRIMAPGVYAIPRLETRARSVLTNTTPIGAYRGAGRPEATAAVERAMDLFAAEIGKDAVEVRRANLLPPFAEPRSSAAGLPYDSGDYAAALERVLDAAGYEQLRQEQAERRARGDVVQLGVGVSVYVEITGASGEAGGPHENATVEVHPDGSATIITGTSPHGQGHATAWAMLASQELGIPLDRIRVVHGDTDLVPEGGGTAGSRSLQQGGAAVRQATRELVDLARHRAAALFEADPDDVIVDLEHQGVTVQGVPHTATTFAELAERERLVVHSVFTAPGPTFPFGAHLAVVEVDTQTGRVVLRRLVAVDDAGVVLNPLLAEGQRYGGLAQGAAQALMEEVVYDADGNPQTATLATYPFVSMTEVPSFELVDMTTPTSYNPLGAKGIGEAATVGSTPAVQSAVIDALAHLGIRHIDLPTTPEHVWRAIQRASTGRRTR